MTPLKKYIWLVDTVMRAGEKGLTLKQIAERYERDENISEGEPYARRTFQRHRDEVLKPESLREEMREEARRMLERYRADTCY